MASLLSIYNSSIYNSITTEFCIQLMLLCFTFTFTCYVLDRTYNYYIQLFNDEVYTPKERMREIIEEECIVQYQNDNDTTKEEKCQIHTEQIYVRSSYRKKLTGKQGRKKKNLVNESGVKDIVVGTSNIEGFKDNYVSVHLKGSRESIEKALTLIQDTIGDNWYNTVFNFEDNDLNSREHYQYKRDKAKEDTVSVLENRSQSNGKAQTTFKATEKIVVDKVIDRERAKAEPLKQLNKATKQPTLEEKKQLTKEELWPYFAFNGALLSSTPPDIRNRIIDEHFYPLINQSHSKQFARDITNMLHNIDVPELLHLYESPEIVNHSPIGNNPTQSPITMAYVPPHRRGKKNTTGNGGSLNELAEISTNHIPANDGNELAERSGSKASKEFSTVDIYDPLLLFLKSQHKCITGNVDEFYTWLINSEDIDSMAALKEAVSDDVYLNEKMKKRDGSSGIKGFKRTTFKKAVLDYEGTDCSMKDDRSFSEDFSSGCNREPPEDLVCPISLVLMTNDPVLAADGITYERASIEDWFQKSKAKGSVIHSPVHGTEMESLILIPNISVRNMARAFKEEK